MSNKANPMVIGGFVLGALALMVTAILLFGSGSLFRTADHMVAYFPGTVQGLRVGASVEYHGVKVGQVTSIRVDLYGEQQRVVVPVYFELWPDSLNVVEGEIDTDRAASFKRAVETQGLRAQLTSVSLVTGQYLVSLVFAPDTPAKLEHRAWDKEVIEIPAIPATRDRIDAMLKGLELDALVRAATGAFTGIKTLADDPAMKALAGNANQLIADLDAGVVPLMKQADGTLADYSQLAKDLGTRVDGIAGRLETTLADISTLSNNVDAEVGPVSKSARGALGQAERAFRSIDGMVGNESPTRYDLDLLLKEGAGAARSLRLLADYLEQNPDALIKGR